MAAQGDQLASSWEVREEDLATPEVGTVWDLCISVEYDRGQLVEGITEWLGAPDGVRVLDCACGSGFPALDLHRLGYDVTCTDASGPMLERFRHNAKAAGIALEPHEARWEELDSLYAETFDAVICRGCSFIYAGTFDDDADPDRSALETSIGNFVHCLRPGGRLYVDAPHEEGLDNEDPQWTEHPPRTMHGREIRMRECVVADPGARIRRWSVELDIDDETFSLQRRSHYMPHAELIGLLQAGGLEDVGRADVGGERYAVFVGQKA